MEKVYQCLGWKLAVEGCMREEGGNRFVKHLPGPGMVHSAVPVHFIFLGKVFSAISYSHRYSSSISVWGGGKEGQRDGGWAQPKVGVEGNSHTLWNGLRALWAGSKKSPLGGG